MPQDYYEQYKKKTAPTTEPSGDYYERYKKSTVIPPPEPAKRGTGYSWGEHFIKPIVSTAINLKKAGQRLSEIPGALLSQSPMYQMNQAMQEISKPEQARINTEAAKPAFENVFTTKPYEMARTVAGAVDPTGIVPDYMDLGSTVKQDIQSGNYGGAAVSAGIGAAPFVLPGVLGRGAKVSTKGIDPAILPKKPTINVVPDVVPPTGPGSFVDIPPKVTPPWDFNADVRNFPDPYGAPRSQGIVTRPEVLAKTKKVPTVEFDETGKPVIKKIDKPIPIGEEASAAMQRRKISGEVASGGDWLADDPLYVTIPERLRPEAPNVAALKTTAEGAGKVGGAVRRKGIEFIDEADYIKQREAVAAAEKAAAEAKRVEAQTAKTTTKRAKAKEEGVSVESIIEEKKKQHPELASPTFTNAIKSLPDRIRNSALYRGLYKPLGVSNITRLERLGESGKQLAKLLRDERTESHRYGGKHASVTREITQTLDKAQQLEVVKILDGQKPLAEASSPKVKEAYYKLRASTEELGNEAVASNIRMKNVAGENVPFQKHAGEYFPRQYPEELFKNPEALRDMLLKKGKDASGNPLSPAAVDTIVKNVIEKGERFSSAQHAREFDLPGYKEDLSALEKHQYEMGQTITRAKKFGPMDVANPDSQISKLIKSTSDPKEAAKIVNDYLNRAEPDLDNAMSQKVYQAAVKAQVATKLSQFALTNLGDFAAIGSRLGVKNTAKSIAKVLADPHGSVDISTRTGAQATIRKGVLDEVGKGNLLGKAYGIDTTEKFIRTVGSIAGRTEAERLFAQAKKNPLFKEKLAKFVDGDVDAVLKQDKLTPEQLDFAGGRAVELTSGIPDKLTLSKGFFADSPILRLPLLFKRFAFLNTKNMAEAIKAEPTLARKTAKAAKIFAAYNVAGEAVGDVKAAISGMVNGDYDEYLNGDFSSGAEKAWEKIKSRGDYVGTGATYIDRMVANSLQAALFGILGDVSESMAMKSRGKVTGTIAGPMGSDLDELASIMASDSWEKMRASAGKAATRRIPFFGQGLSEKYFGKEKNNKLNFKELETVKSR